MQQLFHRLHGVAGFDQPGQRLVAQVHGHRHRRRTPLAPTTAAPAVADDRTLAAADRYDAAPPRIVLFKWCVGLG
jgi:hypothetical protein